MKLFYIISLSIFLLKCGSNKNGRPINKTPMVDTTSESVVKIHNVSYYADNPNFIETEYYVLNKQDTSSFSCNIIENQMNKTIFIMCEYSFNEKKNNSTSDSDSAKVGIVPDQKLEVKLITYDNFIRELRLILNTASKQFNFSRLKSFSIRMICVSGLTTYLSQQSILKYNRSINKIGILKVTLLLQESPLTADLNSILKPYSVCINELYIEEYLFFPLKSKYRNFKYLVQCPNKKEEQEVMGMDGSAVFTLKPTN